MTDLAEQIQKNKQLLVERYQTDDNGYNLIHHLDFAKYVSETLILYAKLIKDSHSKQSKISCDKIINEAFSFNKIRFTDINFDTIEYGIRTRVLDSKLFINNNYLKIININITDSQIDRLYLNEEKQLKMLGSLTINNTYVDIFNIVSPLLEDKDLAPDLFVTNSTINNFSIAGNTKESAIYIALSFSDCIFLSHISCEKVIFGKEVSFQSCHFGEKHNLKSDRYKPASCQFSFNNSEFTTSTKFEHCHFWQSPKFHGAILHSDTSFQETAFHDRISFNANANYRALKQLTEKLGAEHDYMLFHALEMESRRKTQLPKWWDIFHERWQETIASYFFKLTTDYNRNFWLPWLCLLSVTALFCIAYWVMDRVGCHMERLLQSELWIQKYCENEERTLQKSMIYSIQKSLGPLGFIYNTDLITAKYAYVKAIAMLQFVTSSILWFILIMQIRRQFKL